MSQLRAQAATMLHAVLDQGQSLRDVKQSLGNNFSDKDNAWLQEMVSGCLRQLPLLEHWLAQLLSKPLKSKQRLIHQVLILGLYQLAFTRVKKHAAVAETVQAAQTLKAGALKGLVNAVLRNFMRQQLAEQPINSAQIQSGLPPWLFNTLTQAYGDNATELFPQMQQQAPLWLRVNTRKISVDDYADKLTAAGIEYSRSALHPAALVLAKSTAVPKLPGFEQGEFAVQDGAAQLAAQLLDPQPQERVLDACAAPGGKTGHILELAPALSECIALELEAERLVRIQENLDRLGHQAKLLQGDASKPQTWWDGQTFDRILLDAPCSATGIIRRHPDIKWLRQAGDIPTLVALQAKILDALWPLLKSGGTLVYATCSILPAENREQIGAFLARTEDAELLPINAEESRLRPGWQIVPGQDGMDGFYYARLRKS